MKMVPIKLINDIVSFKDRISVLNSFTLLGAAGVAHIIEYNTGNTSMWWYFLTFAIAMVINITLNIIYKMRLNKQLIDYVQEENYEIATMIADKKLVNPSHIKPVLDKISESTEYACEKK